MNEPTVSVVVPAYRGGALFDLCLRSLRQLSPPPLEILIVADGQCRDSAARARAAGFRVITLDEQSGPAIARNRGAAEARGEILFFVDADVTVPADACARIVRAFADPGPAALIGSYDDSQPRRTSSRSTRTLRTGSCTSAPIQTASRSGARAARSATTAFRGGRRLRCSLHVRPASRTSSWATDCVARAAHHRRRTLEVTHLKRWSAASLLRADIDARALPWSALILQRGTNRTTI